MARRFRNAGANARAQIEASEFYAEWAARGGLPAERATRTVDDAQFEVIEMKGEDPEDVARRMREEQKRAWLAEMGGE